MGEDFRPSINIQWGSVAQYSGMFLQGNLQFFINSDSGLTYIGITNLFNVATGGLHISALRGNITAGPCTVLLLMRAMTALILQFILTFQVELLINIDPINTGIKFYDNNPTGAEDFYIDIPGCGNQRFTKSVSQLNIGVCNQKIVNMNSQRHQTTETSEVPWDYIFLPKRKN